MDFTQREKNAKKNNPQQYKYEMAKEIVADFAPLNKKTSIKKLFNENYHSKK